MMVICFVLMSLEFFRLKVQVYIESRILRVPGAVKRLWATDRMFVGVYNGIYLLEKKAGEWHMLCKIEGFVDSSRLFEQESARILWVHNSGIITRVELSEDLTRQISVKSYGVAEGFPVERDIYVAKIEGRVYFATSHGIYKYNIHKDMMEPCGDMNNLLNGTVPYTRLLEYHDPAHQSEPL